MRNFALILLTFITLSSCDKENDFGDGYGQSCTCGVVVDRRISDCYELLVESHCSENVKGFCFDQIKWYNYNVGDKICITDGELPW
jgi:hypothetical protein